MKHLTLLAVLFLFTANPASAAPAALGNLKAPKGGTFILNLTSEPTTINPITSTDLPAQQVQSFIIEGLMNRNEDTYDFDPGIAESYKITEDGKVFTFKLRDGVTWHDGKPFTAEDVKFSFDVIFNDKYPTAHMRPYYEGIEKVEIIDPKTVKFTTKDKYFKNFEVVAGLSLIPKHVYEDAEKGKTLNREIIGTGPYKLDKYEKGKRIVLKRNDKWWGNSVAFYKGQHNFNEIVMRFVTENNVAFEMLKKGEIDFEEFTPEYYTDKAVGPEWGKKVIKVKTVNKGPKPYGFIGWNLTRPIFQDKRIRIALTHLVNRRMMIEKFLYGMSDPATGPWHIASDYASKKVKPFEFDPKKALVLLKEAGWEDSDKDGVLDKIIDGKKTRFEISIYTANEDAMKYLTVFKQDAKQAGIVIDTKRLEWNSFIKLLDERKFDGMMLSWGAGSVDLDPKQIWHSDSAVASGSNFIGYKNPEVDKLIDQARQIMDKKKRLPVLQKVYELIAADAPYTFLFNARNSLYGHTAKTKKPSDTFKYAIGTAFWWTE